MTSRQAKFRNNHTCSYSKNKALLYLADEVVFSWHHETDTLRNRHKIQKKAINYDNWNLFSTKKSQYKFPKHSSRRGCRYVWRAASSFQCKHMWPGLSKFSISRTLTANRSLNVKGYELCSEYKIKSVSKLYSTFSASTSLHLRVKNSEMRQTKWLGFPLIWTNSESIKLLLANVRHF